MKQLYSPGPDGVVELRSKQRTLPGGRGQSARRWTRPMSRTEAYVWLPVAASEDLTPRQLRVYALISYAQDRGIPVAEAELAASLHHHSGARAGQRLTVTAASAIVDAIEGAGWLTVHRRAGSVGATSTSPTTFPVSRRLAPWGPRKAARTRSARPRPAPRLVRGPVPRLMRGSSRMRNHLGLTHMRTGVRPSLPP